MAISQALAKCFLGFLPRKLCIFAVCDNCRDAGRVLPARPGYPLPTWNPARPGYYPAGQARLRARLLPGRPGYVPGYYPAGRGGSCCQASRGRAAATIARRESAARPSLIRPQRFFARYTHPPPATWKRDRNAQGAASGIPGPPRPEAGRPPQPGRTRP